MLISLNHFFVSKLNPPFSLIYTQDFHADAIEKFIEESSLPLVTLFNKDPDNHPFVIKFFNKDNSKVMSVYILLKFSPYSFYLKMCELL